MTENETSFEKSPERLLWWTVHCGICLQNKSMLIKNILSVLYIYLHINDMAKTGFIIHMTSISSNRAIYGDIIK